MAAQRANGPEEAPYTRRCLEVVVRGIFETTGMTGIDLYLEAVRLPQALGYAAERCFVYQLSEGADTRLIRRALTDLRDHGCFRFESVAL